MVFSSTVFLFTFLQPYYSSTIYALEDGAMLFSWRQAWHSMAGGNPRYIIVMVLSILFNYGSGLVMGHLKGGIRPSRLTLAFSVAGNLLILGCFKYADFFIENINELIGSSFGLLQLTLPIGISFYTFQAMSYVIDVYRGKVRPQRNILDFATYITLFPQLIAGPIVRYVTVEEQLRSRKYSLEQGAEGVRRFIIGLGKKCY